MKTPTTSPGWTRFLPLILLLATALAYFNSLEGVFLFDDHVAIRENPYIQSLWPLGNAFRAPLEASTNRRPVAQFSLAINYAIGGLEPAGYHVANILIHGLCVLLLYGIVRRSLATPGLAPRFGARAAPIAFAAALLWSVHPLLTETVDYVTQRTESLAALFLLATLYCAIRAASATPSRGWTTLAVVSCALGVGSKETAWLAPLLVLLYDRAFFTGSFAKAWRRRSGLYIALAATWILAAAIWILVPTDQLWGFAIEGLSPIRYALTQAGVVLHYLRLAFWPSPLVIDYDGWPIARDAGSALPAVVALLALVAAAAWACARHPRAGFLGAAFFLLLAPTSSFYPIPTEVAAERRMYLPLAALIVLLLVAWDRFARPALSRLLGARPRAGAEALLLAALAASLCWATTRRNLDYRDERAMWQDVLAKRPGSPRARCNLGVVQLRRGQVAPALDEFTEAARLRPSWSIPRFNRANALRALGRNDEALAEFQAAVDLRPSWDEARLNLGAALLESGRIEEALTHFTAVARARPDWPEARNNLGFALLRSGQTAEAAAEFREAIRLRPDFAVAHNNLGKAVAAGGNAEEAARHVTDAVRLDPNLLDAWNTLGLLRAGQGRREEAIQHFRQALAGNPALSEVRVNLAMTLLADGRADEAIATAAEGAQGEPGSAAAHHALAMVLSRAGRARESVEALREAVRLNPGWVEAINNLAWALATSPDPGLRDGAEAVRLAEEAAEKSGRALPNVLDTLGAAYAEAGRWSDAVRAADLAIERARAAQQLALAEEVARRRDLYAARRAYHEPS